LTTRSLDLLITSALIYLYVRNRGVCSLFFKSRGVGGQSERRQSRIQSPETRMQNWRSGQHSDCHNMWCQMNGRPQFPCPLLGPQAAWGVASAH